MFMSCYIKHMFFGLDLFRIGSGIFRNMLKSYCSVSEAPSVFVLFIKCTFSRLLDTVNSQTVTFKLRSVSEAPAFLFSENTHFHKFGHGNFSKSVFLVKHSICGVINCQRICVFAHIVGPSVHKKT